MSTHTEPEPVTTEPSRAIPVVEHPAQPDIKIYSHSPILYWWPVWVVGFLMALLTYLDGGRLAVVPPGTEARRDWRVEVEPGRFETREGLILPPSSAGRTAHLAPADGPVRPGGPLPPPERPRVRMASSPFLGTWFFLVVLLVFVSSNVPLRGLWEWVGVLA